MSLELEAEMMEFCAKLLFNSYCWWVRVCAELKGRVLRD